VKETSEDVMKSRGGLAFVSSLGDFGRQSGVTIQHFLFMVGASVIEHYVADHHEEFLALTTEPPGQRVLAGNVYESLTHPLPELLLRGPELVVVGTDYSRRLLRCHCYTYDHRAAYAQSPAARATWPLILLPAEEPKHKRQDYAQKNRSHERKIKSPSVSFNIDVAWKSSDPQSRKPSGQQQERANRDNRRAQQDQVSTDCSQTVRHNRIFER
jgi:hypothetical protein